VRFGVVARCRHHSLQAAVSARERKQCLHVGWHLNPRGAGFFFGMDEARRFNAANGLRMIVRSHELVQKGFAVGGKKDVITVFSAADYRNKGNNGAVPDLHAVGFRVGSRVGFLVTPCGFLWSSLRHERRCGITQGCCRNVNAGIRGAIHAPCQQSGSC